MNWISVKDRLPEKQGKYLVWMQSFYGPPYPEVRSYFGKKYDRNWPYYIEHNCLRFWAEIEPPEEE